MDKANGGNQDAFVVQVNAAGSSRTFSTYLGGTSNDEARGVALDLLGNVYVAGITSSTDFTTTANAYDSSHSGSNDAFIVKIAPGTAAPVITSISSDSGSSSSDEITTDQTLTISGTAPPSSTINVYKPGESAALNGSTITADGSGNWSFDYTGTSLTEGTHAFWATATASSIVSDPSNTFLVTVDLTNPTVTLSAPSTTTSFAPQVKVLASDLSGFASSHTVTIDVDLNNDNDFSDGGESAHSTGTMANGYALITLTALAATGTVKLRARVNDLAGNEGTSSTATMVVSSQTSWSLSSDTAALTSEPAEGAVRDHLGALTLAHAIDMDQSPGALQAGSALLVYDGRTVTPRPVIQGVLTAINNASLPANISVELIWDGSSQGTDTYSTSALQKGDKISVAAQVDSAAATGRHTWELRVTPAGGSTISQSGVTFVVNQDASVFGAGWNLSTLNRLIDIPSSGANPAGKLWLYGSGGWRFFSGTSGTLTAPPEENGTLVKNGDGTFTYTAAAGWVIQFDSSGYQTSWTSADTKESYSFTYSSGNVSGFTAIDGSTSTFNYTSSKVSSISVPGSRTFTLTVNGSTGDLTSITNADSGVHSFEYNANHRMTRELFVNLENNWAYNSTTGLLNQHKWGTSSTPSVFTLVPQASQGLGGLVKGEPRATVTDALTYATAYRFDAKGRILEQVNPDGGVSTWERDSAGRATDFTDPLGRLWEYTRDAYGFVTQEDLPDTNYRTWVYHGTYRNLPTSYTDERGKTTTWTINHSNGHVEKMIDALLNETDYSYNSTTGLLETITLPKAQSSDTTRRTTEMTYDGYRRVDVVTNKFGSTVLSSADHGYDARGHMSTVTDAGSLTTTYIHDYMGRQTSLQVGALNAATWTFNGAGVLTESENENDHKTTITLDTYKRGLTEVVTEASGTSVARTLLSQFNNAGQTTGSRDSLGYWTTYVPDSMGRTVQTLDSFGNYALSRFNLGGELTASFDPLGGLTTYTRNVRGWLTEMVDAAGKINEWERDAAGNETKFIDPNLKEWLKEYDDLGRVKETTDPESNVFEFTFWGDGRPRKTIDGRGIVTEENVDFTNRKNLVTYAHGTGGARTTAEYFNNVGFVTQFEDHLGHDTYFEDNGNHDIDKVKDHNNVVKVDYTRDAFGNITQIKDGLNEITALAYDARELQVSRTDPNGNVTKPLWPPHWHPSQDRRECHDQQHSVHLGQRRPRYPRNLNPGIHSELQLRQDQPTDSRQRRQLQLRRQRQPHDERICHRHGQSLLDRRNLELHVGRGRQS